MDIEQAESIVARTEEKFRAGAVNDPNLDIMLIANLLGNSNAYEELVKQDWIPVSIGNKLSFVGLAFTNRALSLIKETLAVNTETLADLTK